MIYHVVASLVWRVLLLLAWPLVRLGAAEPALYAAFMVIYHDEQTCL
jgi:hypothetical protein